ncbi:hypothetical protein [Streptomyces cellulosae]|uniref:hypothetical protein n=1 Tax=Streptomyces cellulosae TaxID=1968 RepID=UPI000A54FABF|nr:hypothetical protein [Streptomyces cellulosae]
MSNIVLITGASSGFGLVIWVSSVKGGTPPCPSPYFAAKAAMDSLAVSYAGELARWGARRRSSSPAPSPGAPATSRTPATRPTARSRRRTRRSAPG